MPFEDTGQWIERATYNSAQKKRKNNKKKKPNQKHAHTQNGCTKCVLDSDHAKKYLVVWH